MNTASSTEDNTALSIFKENRSVETIEIQHISSSFDLTSTVSVAIFALEAIATSYLELKFRTLIFLRLTWVLLMEMIFSISSMVSGERS